MRNYLPAKNKKIKGSKFKFRLSRRIAATIGMILAVSTIGTFVAIKLAHAAPACITTVQIAQGNSTVFPQSGHNAEWDAGGYHYAVYEIYTHSNSAAEDAVCYSSVNSQTYNVVAGQRVTNTASPFNYKYSYNDVSSPAGNHTDYVQPVGVRLGVWGQVGPGGDNNGAWAALSTDTAGSYVRPPQYFRNFDSPAAFADDGGLFSINSPRYGNHTLWCLRLDILPSEVPGLAAKVPTSAQCAPDVGDASAYPTPDQQSGSGNMFVQDNCHFSNPDNGYANVATKPALPANQGLKNENYDQDRYPYPLATLQCDINKNPGAYSWYRPLANPNEYWNPAVKLNSDFTVGHGDLSSFIGCGGGDCNGPTDTLDNFTMEQYSRNTSAKITSAETFLTFKYPIPAVVQTVIKPFNCYYPVNTAITSGNCQGGGTGSGKNGYVVTFYLLNGTVGTLKAVNTVPSYMHYAANNANGPPAGGTMACTANTGAPGVGPPGNTGNGGGTVTWSLNATNPTTNNPIDHLNATGLDNPLGLQLCFAATTNATIPSALLAQPDSVVTTGTSNLGLPLITLNSSGSVSSTESSQNFIYSPEYPFLTTSGGDVHAGGGFPAGLSLNCNSVTAKIKGNTAGGSKGDYVVSANGSLNSFGSGNGGGLGIASYHGICRPNLALEAASYPTVDVVTNSTAAGLTAAVTNAINNDAPGTLIITTCDTVLDLGSLNPVHKNITLWVQGNLTIKSDVLEASSATGVTPVNLGSFGVITGALDSQNNLVPGTGDIDIVKNVSTLQGFFYALGRINTCTDGNGTPYTSVGGASALTLNCQGGLNVLGLLSADSFDFNRVGPISNTGSQQSEGVGFTGLLFLAPPPVFSENFTNTPQGPTNITVQPPLF